MGMGVVIMVRLPIVVVMIVVVVVTQMRGGRVLFPAGEERRQTIVEPPEAVTPSVVRSMAGGAVGERVLLPVMAELKQELAPTPRHFAGEPAARALTNKPAILCPAVLGGRS